MPPNEHAGRELAAAEDAQVDHRMVDRKLAPHEQRERSAAGDGVGPDLARGEPVEPLAALEHGLERADAEREQPRPGQSTRATLRAKRESRT
jgi:hypothetical protein